MKIERDKACEFIEFNRLPRPSAKQIVLMGATNSVFAALMPFADRFPIGVLPISVFIIICHIVIGVKLNKNVNANYRDICLYYSLLFLLFSANFLMISTCLTASASESIWDWMILLLTYILSFVGCFFLIIAAIKRGEYQKNKKASNKLKIAGASAGLLVISISRFLFNIPNQALSDKIFSALILIGSITFLYLGLNSLIKYYLLKHCTEIKTVNV